MKFIKIKLLLFSKLRHQRNYLQGSIMKLLDLTVTSLLPLIMTRYKNLMTKCIQERAKKYNMSGVIELVQVIETLQQMKVQPSPEVVGK